MGATRTLTKQINWTSLATAKLSAAKRWEKYLNAAQRRRVRIMTESRELKLAAKEK